MVVNLVVSPQDLKREKRAHSLFQSLLPGKERRIHAIIIISFALVARPPSVSFLCAKKENDGKQRRGHDGVGVAQGHHADIYMYNTTFEWPDLFLTGQPKSGPTISKKQKRK